MSRKPKKHSELAQGRNDKKTAASRFKASWHGKSAIGRERYGKMLTERLRALGHKPYRKNDPDMFVKLEPFMTAGIRNAKKLAKANEGKSPSAACPGTRVHELVEYLLPFIG